MVKHGDKLWGGVVATVGTPIPLIDRFTQFIPAGPVCVAVEYRNLSAAMAQDMQEINGEGQKLTNADLFSDDIGVSFHVFATDDTDDGYFEKLRFDCFSGWPHFHYLNRPEGYIVTAPIEAADEPAAREFFFAQFAGNLPEMLRRCGCEKAAASASARDSEVQAALPALRAAVDVALANVPTQEESLLEQQRVLATSGQHPRLPASVDPAVAVSFPAA